MLTNRKQLWVSTYHGAKNSTNIISSPFTPSLKSLSPSSITSEQKTADANKGIKIVEIIILKQNGEDEIMLGSMHKTRWNKGGRVTVPKMLCARNWSITGNSKELEGCRLQISVAKLEVSKVVKGWFLCGIWIFDVYLLCGSNLLC